MLIIALIGAALLFALLLYPLIVAQIGMLLSRLPHYVGLLRGLASEA